MALVALCEKAMLTAQLLVQDRQSSPMLYNKHALPWKALPVQQKWMNPNSKFGKKKLNSVKKRRVTDEAHIKRSTTQQGTGQNSKT
ncbi:hypothetical protein VNO78_20112 [Psophocarpus tetragonolobus]|uniref:Uncharacterized protein n=1 Tax=Psophocarpus tetragonolobus TaxID=3891 RepID=A0AAN9S8R6_PSOTE